MRTSLVLVAALALTFAAVAVRGDDLESRTFGSSSGGRCSNKKPSAPKSLAASPLNPTTVRLTWRAKDDACVDEFEITVSRARRGCHPRRRPPAHHYPWLGVHF
jgi:hypothetical protein